MRKQTNTCLKCGGITTYFYSVETIYPGDTRSEKIATSSTSFRVCTCPIEREKHDGKLDTAKHWFHAYVEHVDNIEMDLSKQQKGIHIHGGYGDGDCNCLYLDPQQALSLLAWLKQEQGTLERLVEEQEHE